MRAAASGRRVGCLVSLATILLCFAVIEAVVRLTMPREDVFVLTGRTSSSDLMSRWAAEDAFCAYTPVPGAYSDGKTVDSFGFISTPEISLEKPEGTVRILFLGESSTAGTGWNLPDTVTWPWQTVELLKQRVPMEIDFMNGAVGGYSSFESYGRLWSRLRFFHPDIVVVNHGWNEMYYFRDAGSITDWRSREEDRDSDGGDPSGSVRIYEPLWVDPFIRWSQLLTLVRLGLSSPVSSGETGPSDPGPLADDFDREGVEIWRTNLVLMREACRVIGAKLFVIKQPTMIVPGLPDDMRVCCRCDFHGFDFEAHIRAYDEIYRVIDEELPPEYVIDLTPLSGDCRLFYDHVHPTPEGAARFAGIVADSLASHLAGAGGPDRSVSIP